MSMGVAGGTARGIEVPGAPGPVPRTATAGKVGAAGTQSSPRDVDAPFTQALADADAQVEKAEKAEKAEKKPGDETAATADDPSPAPPSVVPVAATPSAVPEAVDQAMLLAQGALVSPARVLEGPTAGASVAVPPTPKGVTALTSDEGTRRSVAAVDALFGTKAGTGVHAQPSLQASQPSQTPAANQRLAQQQEDLRATPQVVPARAATAEAVVVPQLVTDITAALRRPESQVERGTGVSAGAPDLSGTGTATATSALMAPVDAGSAAASAGGAGLAERMVEQVSWWVSQKTQGAELTLDVAAGQTVSVSVQVQGNEAQVVFRSDQPEVRQMLGQASAQLKELLGNEGLLLSGVSVGTQTDPGTGQDAARQAAGEAAAARRDARVFGQGTVVAPEPARLAAVGPRAPSGRSLDLYV